MNPEVIPEPLDESGHRLILENLGLARAAAARVRVASLDQDERLSSAFFGLCEAADDWTAGGTTGNFRLYASARMYWRIFQDARSARRRASFTDIRGNRWRRDPDAAIDVAAADVPAPLQHLVVRETVAAVEQAMQCIPPRQRRALELVRDGMPTSEVGPSLGIGVSGGYALIRRGATAVRKLCESTGATEGEEA